ncbi:hypothetical protein F5Y01DRAFT_294292 [Xylaria sp. FL0043]|nr:hypothetical protein F5Y01DRAFT_294292 [Xylaria sp. FL0043]
MGLGIRLALLLCDVLCSIYISLDFSLVVIRFGFGRCVVYLLTYRYFLLCGGGIVLSAAEVKGRDATTVLRYCCCCYGGFGQNQVACLK